MATDKQPSNEWQIEGYLGKKEYIKKGMSKTGKPWMLHSVAVFAGKDKSTGKNKYDNIGFFVPQDDHAVFERFPEKTKIRLRGKAVANSYINKDGELIQKLSIQVPWEDYYEVVEEEEYQQILEDVDHSDEPF